MKLLIDVGNSRIKWVIINDLNRSYNFLVSKGFVDLKDKSFFAKNKENSIFFKKLSNSIKQIPRQGKKTTLKINIGWICVAPKVVEKRVIEVLKTILGNTPPKKIKTPENGICKLELNCGSVEVSCIYDEPKTLGSDRWLALIGLASLGPPENLLRKKNHEITLISAGTATVMDRIFWKKIQNNKWKCVLKTGFIAPGFRTMSDSLDFVLRKPKKNYSKLNLHPKNTIEAISSGIALCQVGMVSREDGMVIVHGGMSREWIKACKFFNSKSIRAVECPWLIFEGILTLINNG